MWLSGYGLGIFEPNRLNAQHIWCSLACIRTNNHALGWQYSPERLLRTVFGWHSFNKEKKHKKNLQTLNTDLVFMFMDITECVNVTPKCHTLSTLKQIFYQLSVWSFCLSFSFTFIFFSFCLMLSFSRTAHRLITFCHYTIYCISKWFHNICICVIWMLFLWTLTDVCLLEGVHGNCVYLGVRKWSLEPHFTCFIVVVAFRWWGICLLCSTALWASLLSLLS